MENRFGNDVVVENGLFNVILDFGDTFAALEQEYWMEILVREGDSNGDYTPLAPLQKVTSSLFAIKADRVPAGSIDSGDIAFNSIVSGNIRDESITSIDILNSTITHFDIQDGTIRSADIKDATITGTDITNNLNLNDTLTWNCPSNTVRVGTWCIETIHNAPTDATNSITRCHDKGMRLCPIDVIIVCDATDTLKGESRSCGTTTDCGTAADNISIRTSTMAGASDSSSFSQLLTYVGCATGDISNNGSFLLSGSDNAFYNCCKPVSE